MPSTTTSPRLRRRAQAGAALPGRRPRRAAARTPRRLACNFAALSGAEVACRALSVAVTLSLARRLGTAGFGRIEFAFNLVFWLVLLVREGLDVIAAREIARHPGLIRPLVNRILAVRTLLATVLLAGLLAFGQFALRGPTERAILALYGLGLLTTALGLDYAFRSLERMGLIAVSLVVRTAIYAVGVALLVTDATRLVWVPACLIFGEACGIALVWVAYARRYGLPRPTLRGRRVFAVFLRRGRSVYLIQVSQAVLASIDLVLVSLIAPWSSVGLYSAPHRMVTAVLTFGLIFQQVAFPSLSRAWRASAESSRRALDALVRVLAVGLVPIAVGATALAGPLVEALFKAEYAEARWLLAIGVWRAPLLTLAFLYQATLIARGREGLAVRILPIGACASVPLVLLLARWLGLPGAALAESLTGLILVVAGYAQLAWEGRNPAWHHHVLRPALAALAMVPVCLGLVEVHLGLAVLGGAVTYFVVLFLLGGLRREDLAVIFRRD